LAISGLLFLIAVIGTGSTIRTIRFTDSGRTTTAFLQQQYDDIINGVNTRSGQETCSSGGSVSNGNQTPGTSDCVLMGKLILFTQNSPTLNVYDVVGTPPAVPNFSESDQQLIVDFQPKVVTNADTSTYDIPWQAFVSGVKRTSDGTATNALLLVRSPKSTRVLNYTYKAVQPISTDLSTVVNAASNVNQTTNFCIKNADGAGAPAKIVVNGATNQSAVQITFDSNDGECNGS
jgi:hypothetical protein